MMSSTPPEPFYNMLYSIDIWRVGTCSCSIEMLEFKE
jgi:hypothetical protein